MLLKLMVADKKVLVAPMIVLEIKNSMKKEKVKDYTFIKMLKKCKQLILLPFDLIVLAKYKGT